MRRKFTLFCTLSAVIASAAAVTLSPTSASMKMGTVLPPPGQGAPAQMGGTYLNVAIPAAIKSIPLISAAGSKISLNSFKGQYVVISNFLTSCQEICPMTTVNMARISDAVQASKLKNKVTVLEVTVDAGRDTPSRLTAYQKLFGVATWTMATGTAANLNTFWTFFGAPATKTNLAAAEIKSMPLDWQTNKPATYDFTHADVVLIVGPDGTWQYLDLGMPKVTDKKIPAKLQSFLSKDGKNNLTKPEEPSWTVDTVLSALRGLSGIKF